MVAGTGSTYLDGLPSAVEQAHTSLPIPQLSGDEIWARILQEVSAKNNVPVQGSLIILGNERCGKSSLLARLANGRQNISSVLEYNYLHIQADSDANYAYQLGGGANGLLGPTDSASLPVWVMDGKDEVAPLLKFSFPSNLAKCVVILCASLEQPGNILPALRRWYRLLDEQIRQHYQPEEIVQARQAQVRFWQEYVEPTESSMGHSTITLAEATSPGVMDQATVPNLLLQPEKGILDENSGAAVFVVITKTDLYTELSPEQLDKVQYHVRQFCLRHGAALFYTSASQELNTQLLHKYIAHRIYSLPFTTPAYIVEKDRIFVPTGWDSEQKLFIVKETLGFANTDVPMLPQQSEQLPFASLKVAEREIEAEDEQTFLNRITSISLDGTPGGSGQQSPRRDGSGGGKPAGDNTMLANFFSSLLTKDNQRTPQTARSGGASSPIPASGGTSASASNAPTANSVDPEAHFQKMLTVGAKGVSVEAGPAATKTARMTRETEQQPSEEDNNNNDDEEFEDAPEGDDENESISLSLGSQSQNVTPRDGMDGGSSNSGDQQKQSPMEEREEEEGEDK